MGSEPRNAAVQERALYAGGRSDVEAPVFVWNDGQRYVEVFSVQTGWLVLWGSQRGTGRRSVLGNRIYLDLGGVRRRIAAAVFELTADRSESAAAVVQFDNARLAN